MHDFFLPGSQLTFQQSAVSQITTIPGVASVTTGLTLLAEHQQGIVPKIVATLKTQQKTYQIQRNIPRPTAAQFAAMQACFAKLRGSSGSGNGNGGTGGGNGPSAGGSLGGSGSGDAGGGFGGSGFAGAPSPSACPRASAAAHAVHDAAADVAPGAESAADEHRDNRLHDRRCRSDAPDAGTRDDVAGHEGTLPRPGRGPRGADLGLIRCQALAQGRLQDLDLNGTSFVVVGIVAPPLGGQTADIYLPLKQLQTLANQKGLVNVALVRRYQELAGQRGAEGDLDRAAERAGRELEAGRGHDQRLARQRVEPLARSRLRDLGVAAVAAFLLAALLALSSVGKRVRELGTLKALGWTQGKVSPADRR